MAKDARNARFWTGIFIFGVRCHMPSKTVKRCQTGTVRCQMATLDIKDISYFMILFL